MMENPNGVMNSDSAPNDNYPDLASRLSEDESRKIILDSYEKAGVDLPLVSLETVLDREISEDDARQTGAPRFRKFLNKASSAMANRSLLNKNHGLEEGPDDEFQPSPLSSSYTSNSYIENEEPRETREAMTELAVTPKKRQMDDSNATEDTDESYEESILKIIPPTPESMKNNCHQAFDFCCPKSLLQPSPSPSPTKSTRSSPSDKYVMSNLQLAEGFDDEQFSTNAQQSRDVPALMDMEDSMFDDSYTLEKPGSSSKTGMLSLFKGSRRFRFAILICCVLHIVLIGLIVAFVTNADNESYEADSSSSALSQAQAGMASLSPTNASPDIVTSKTLIPDLDLESELDLSEPELESETDSVVEATTSSNAFNSTTEQPIDILEEENILAEDNVFEENALPESEEEQPTGEDSSQNPCVNSLEVSTECVGQGLELLVFFESCTPRPGDWIAIYESSADPRFLLDDESVAWLYTCGDRFCEEVTETETLSFTRATERAGVGTYRAHLIREGDGPTFSSVASSSDFRIVANANASC